MTKSSCQYIDGGKSADLHRDYVSGRKWKYAPTWKLRDVSQDIHRIQYFILHTEERPVRAV